VARVESKEGEFATAWAEGAAMQAARAIAYALRELGEAATLAAF
jgi:hypothetical protein